MCDSHALQQEHYGVQLLPGSVIRSQRHDEVVKAVPGAFSRHDDQLVLETIRASVLVGHVLARLGHEENKSAWSEKISQLNQAHKCTLPVKNKDII